MTRDRPDPGDLTPREAVQRYLRRRRADATEASIQSWKYQLKLFVEWCESVGIDRVGEIRGYDLDEYHEIRRGDVAPLTLQMEMFALKKFAAYLVSIQAVEDDKLPERVRVPDVDRSDRSDDTQLPADRALPLLRHYRTDPDEFGSRLHVLLELAWVTGARVGGLRGLDVRDVYLRESFVEFRHRPDTGTPLKNKRDGERPVAVPDETAGALAWYIHHRRYAVHDDHGRQPLLPSTHGRPTKNTVRSWCYQATQPCQRQDCPHGKERESCDWTIQTKASQCPSSRSPHQIRTGSITWQLNLGIPPEVVSERVNSSTKVIKQHYDKPTTEDRIHRQRREMRGRREYIDQLPIDHEPETEV